ncbi:hypothetical protein BCV70DRAFT_72458 [Testicularia cyperi]|uniref:Uncharacterized protein n=1 Tax=Testicularia cyperi TaxID=1882483 RepID=A0A317XTX0_9BASI|nr:hypothetical protein BCV70DRAFT_72458 [Testicularia cyperi]
MAQKLGILSLCISPGLGGKEDGQTDALSFSEVEAATMGRLACWPFPPGRLCPPLLYLLFSFPSHQISISCGCLVCRALFQQYSKKLLRWLHVAIMHLAMARSTPALKCLTRLAGSLPRFTFRGGRRFGKASLLIPPRSCIESRHRSYSLPSHATASGHLASSLLAVGRHLFQPGRHRAVGTFSIHVLYLYVLQQRQPNQLQRSEKHAEHFVERENESRIRRGI